MKRKKRFYFLQIFFIFVLMIFLIEIISGLGVSPAKVEVNFKSGFEKIISYGVYGTDSEQELELYVAGDLTECVKLNKKKLVGGGVFTATLKLPDYIEKPGKHRILVGVKEKIDEELVGAIGTSVTIQSVIDIYVPYPGKYLGVTLKSHNVNVGEPVNFELEIISGGKEDVNVIPKIEIVSQEKTIETLYLSERLIKSQESIKLKKILDTSDYNPGNYKAIVIVDYGKIAKAESEFRIGDLIVNMINYTDKIIIGGLRKFDIAIESGWNNKIDGAYAEVLIFNGDEKIADFKTSSTILTPWETKTIEGFLDTTGFSQGVYDANITLLYYGKDVGRSSGEIVKVEFVKPFNIVLLIISVTLGIAILMVVGFAIKKYLLKNGKKKHKKGNEK